MLSFPSALSGSTREKEFTTAMNSRIAVALYVLAMVAVIIGVDFLFLRDRFWERLSVNVAIVLAFGAFYMLFLRRG